MASNASVVLLYADEDFQEPPPPTVNTYVK